MALDFARVFNFLQGNSIMHRFDPRAKLLMVVIFSILAFLYNTLGEMILLFFLCLFFLFLSNMIMEFFKGLKSISLILIIIIILQSYFVSLNNALIISLRFIILMGIYSIFFQTTHPDDFMQALIKMRVSYSIAFAISLAFRFIPTIAKETQIINEAQKSRGHRIEEGGMIQQIRNLFPLLIPLLSNSIRRANNVAEALESRAFGIEIKRTFYNPIKFKVMDGFFVTMNLIFLIIGILIYFQSDFFSILFFNITL